MRSFALSLLLAAPALAGPAQPSLEEAEKTIAGRFSKIQSLAAKITNEEVDAEGVEKTTLTTIRQVQWMRKGKGFLYRSETRTSIVRSAAGGATSRDAVSTTVSDGERVLRLATQDGTTTAVHRRAEVTETPDVAAMLRRLREDSTLKRLSDVKVGTDDCYAIQVVPKDRKNSNIAQTMIYFRKDIGLDVRTVVYDKDNKPIFTSTTTEVRVNLSFPPDLFVLTIPDGVDVIDQTK